MKTNMLNSSQSYHLRAWLDRRRDHAKSTVAAQLAREAHTELGFKVTQDNINSARRDLGIAPRTSVGGGAVFVQRTVAIALAVCDLYERLGEDCPEEIREIAEKKK